MTDGVTTDTQEFNLVILPGANDFRVDPEPTATASNNPPMIDLPTTVKFERLVSLEGDPIEDKDY